MRGRGITSGVTSDKGRNTGTSVFLKLSTETIEGEVGVKSKWKKTVTGGQRSRLPEERQE